MKLNLYFRNPRVMALVITLVLTLGLVLLFGAPAQMAQAQATDTPTPTSTFTPTNTATPTQTRFPVDVNSASAGGFVCIAGSIDCIQSQHGGGIHIYNDSTGENVFGVNGSTGAINAGSLTLKTPLASSSIQTPTPNLLYGNTPAAVKEVCKSVTIIGSATVTAPGISTPLAVTYGSSVDPGGNVDYVSHTNSAGVVTVKTWKILSGTPAAATTAVPVDVCIKGN